MPAQPISRWRNLLFWAANEREQFGLLLALGVGVLLGVLFLFVWPHGSVVYTRGRVLDPAVLGGRRGLEQGATVAVDGRTVWLYLTPTKDCLVGDVIQLERRRTPWGVDYQEPFIPEPCTRP